MNRCNTLLQGTWENIGYQWPHRYRRVCLASTGLCVVAWFGRFLPAHYPAMIWYSATFFFTWVRVPIWQLRAKHLFVSWNLCSHNMHNSRPCPCGERRPSWNSSLAYKCRVRWYWKETGSDPENPLRVEGFTFNTYPSSVELWWTLGDPIVSSPTDDWNYKNQSYI